MRRARAVALVFALAGGYAYSVDYRDLQAVPRPYPQPQAPKYCLDGSEFDYSDLPPGWKCSNPLITVDSTNYCLKGRMANGRRVHDGAVAMNGIPFGTRYMIMSGPLNGKTLTVEDRIGHGSQFDVWVASCKDARAYGRHTIQIRRLP